MAALCGIAGLILSLIGRRLAVGATAAGAAGAVALLVMQGSVKTQAQQQGTDMMQVSMESGYTFALLLLISGAAWNLYLVLQARGIVRAGDVAKDAHGPPPERSQFRVQSAADIPSPIAVAHPNAEAAGRFCTRCRMQMAADTRFCESCGAAREHTQPTPYAGARE
jgi:hypothetical protein